jgi:hypothetical protein
MSQVNVMPIKLSSFNAQEEGKRAERRDFSSHPGDRERDIFRAVERLLCDCVIRSGVCAQQRGRL